MDRIEKQVVLRAPRARVWRAIADSQEFGAWFGCRLDAPFVAGETVEGRITTPGYDHLRMTLLVDRVEPERVLAFRWHPYAVDASVDYSGEEPTLVTFTLDDADRGTRLTVVESGFDRLPAARRAEAFRMNDGGWTQQVRNIVKHVG